MAQETTPALTPAAPTFRQDGFFGHPRGLATLFFTEFWERFSYYGMRALLLLFMTADVAKGGLGFNPATGGAIYGLYTGCVYLASLPGGWIADRLLGQRRSVFAGGCIIALGHFCLAITGQTTFFLGLLLIIIGTGLLKPNVSTMVGELYPEGGTRRDAGFSIFYSGINLGAFVAPLVCGPLGQGIGWHVGFAAAGFGMVVGVVQYSLGGKNLGDAGLRPNAGSDRVAQRSALRMLIVGAVALAAVVFLMVGVLQISAVTLAKSMFFVISGLAVVYFLFQIFAGGLVAIEKKRMVVIFALFVFSVLFWAGFEQAGSSLNLFADQLTRLPLFHLGGWNWEMPSSVLQAFNPLFIILLAPAFGWLWLRLGSRNPSSPTKFALGLFFMGAGFLVMAWGATYTLSGGKVSPMWLIVTYMLHTWGELCLSPVGLSTVTKLAPHRKVSQLMGIWFMSLSLGNLAAGLIAGSFKSFPLPHIFGAVALAGGVGAVILAFLVKPIRRLMGDVL